MKQPNKNISSHFYKPFPKIVSPISKKVPSAEDLGKLIVKTAAATGIIIVGTYCAREHFFPSGLSAGDTIFFLFVSLIFGLVYGYLVGASIFVCEPIAKWMIRNRNKKEKSDEKPKSSREEQLSKTHYLRLINIFNLGILGVLRILVAVFLAIFYVLLVKTNDWSQPLLFVLVMVMVGCTIYIIFLGKEPELKGKSWLRSLVIGTVVMSPLILVPSLLSGMIDTTMSVIGIRIENATIELPIDEYVFIQAASKRLGNELADCEVLEGKNCLLIADIIFQGVGDKALIEIPFDKKNQNLKTKKKEIRAIVNSHTMKIAKLQIK